MGKKKNNKKVSFKSKSKEIPEYESVKLFLEKEIEESYSKYYESSFDKNLNINNTNFKEYVKKNEELYKIYERKKRALYIISNTKITLKKTSVEEYFYRFYRDKIYNKSIMYN